VRFGAVYRQDGAVWCGFLQYIRWLGLDILRETEGSVRFNFFEPFDISGSEIIWSSVVRTIHVQTSFKTISWGHFFLNGFFNYSLMQFNLKKEI
jgi:hypothetical protein